MTRAVKYLERAREHEEYMISKLRLRDNADKIQRWALAEESLLAAGAHASIATAFRAMAAEEAAEDASDESVV